jgi:uncharacterized protein (DUF4415 family)
MKDRTSKDRRGPPTGTRTGPRARAAQERAFGDPYQRAERPPRRDEAPDAEPRERLHAAPAIRLDADVARVFRDAESVNEALRLVMRLARLAGGRPPGPPRERSDGPPWTRSAGPPRERSAGPPRERGASFRDRGGPPRPRDAAGRPPPRGRKPRFEA